MANQDGICCKMLRSQLNWKCPDHSIPSDCPDALVGRMNTKRYGLYIHDGGDSYIQIHFCPWCGAKLSELRKAARSALSVTE